MESVNFDKQMVVKNAIDPAAARAATTNGTAIDLARTAYGSMRVKSVTFVFTTGVVTDGSYVLSVEESDASGSGFAAISTNRISTAAQAVAATDDSVSFAVHAAPTKRYARLVVTATGTTTGGIYSAVAILHAE